MRKEKIEKIKENKLARVPFVIRSIWMDVERSIKIKKGRLTFITFSILLGPKSCCCVCLFVCFFFFFNFRKH